MYQGIMTTSNHGPPSYEAGFLHNTSPVYVPTTRVVTPMLPYLQTPGGSQQSSPGTSHSAWAQPGADPVSSYNHSPVSPRFFSASPPSPLSSGVVAQAQARDPAASYGNMSGARSLGGSYHSPYPAYMSPNVGGTWPASPFDSPVLHGLQPGAPARHPNIGEKLLSLQKIFTLLYIYMHLFLYRRDMMRVVTWQFCSFPGKVAPNRLFDQSVKFPTK